MLRGPQFDRVRDDSAVYAEITSRRAMVIEPAGPGRRRAPAHRIVEPLDAMPQTFAAEAMPEAVAAEAEELGASRVMLIASDRESAQADRIAEQVPVVLRHDEVVMHVPVDVAGRARAAAAGSGADMLVSIGGGSATGLAKAVARDTGLPIVAVPTTYSGSEATNVWGLTDNGIKTTGVDDRVLPAAVVYDATLLTSLPRELTVASALNALAHCVDSMWGPRTDPIDQALAQAARDLVVQSAARQVDQDVLAGNAFAFFRPHGASGGRG